MDLPLVFDIFDRPFLIMAYGAKTMDLPRTSPLFSICMAQRICMDGPKNAENLQARFEFQRNL
jgi:hypothetical protein